MRMANRIFVVCMGFFLLFFPLYFSPWELVAESSAAIQEERRLDEQIRELYSQLARGRELLGWEKIQRLPNQTIVRFTGAYPNRNGLRIIKYQIQTDPHDTKTIASSEEKSIYLEFNGSVLSRFEYSVTISETGSSPRLLTRIVDETPMDDDINDIQIQAVEGFQESSSYLASLSNEGYNRQRNNFKKNFYLKMLQDSLSQVNLILTLQKQDQNRNQQKRMNQLQNSLKY